MAERGAAGFLAKKSRFFHGRFCQEFFWIFSCRIFMMDLHAEFS